MPTLKILVFLLEIYFVCSSQINGSTNELAGFNLNINSGVNEAECQIWKPIVSQLRLEKILLFNQLIEVAHAKKDCNKHLSELETFVIELQRKINSFPPVPNGATGCDEQYTGGYCWRYCQGTSDKWCYTNRNCSGGNDCAKMSKCDGISCEKDQPNCVKYC